MANKETNNFKQALNELLSGKTSSEEKSAPPLFNEEKPKEEPKVEEIVVEQELKGEINNIEISQDFSVKEQDDESQKVVAEIENAILNNQAAQETETEEQQDAGIVEPQIEKSPNVSVISSMEQAIGNTTETVIAHDVIIEGNVRSSSKLRIVGEVTGDVKSTADVVIEGKVGGSIQGNNIYLSECEVNNNVNASNEITISEGSMINGDIKAGSITSNGVVNGNIDAQTVALNSASRTVGDVKCKLIKIGEGAGLKGKLETID